MKKFLLGLALVCFAALLDFAFWQNFHTVHDGPPSAGDFEWTNPVAVSEGGIDYMTGFSISARETFTYNHTTGVVRWPNALGETRMLTGAQKAAFEKWLLATRPPGWFHGYEDYEYKRFGSPYELKHGGTQSSQAPN